MSIEQVRVYLDRWNRSKDIIEMEISTATVELASAALGVIPARIAKSISLRKDNNGALMIVTAGDTKLDNRKFKDHFGFKPRMLSGEGKYSSCSIIIQLLLSLLNHAIFNS